MGVTLWHLKVRPATELLEHFEGCTRLSLPRRPGVAHGVERHPVQTYGLAFPTPHGRRELLNRSTPTVDEDVAMNIGAPLIPLRLVDRFPSQQYPDRVFVQRNRDRFTRFGLVARHKAALSIPIDSFPEEPGDI